MDNNISIAREVYQAFLKDRFFADAMRSLLANKRKEDKSIYADEIGTICKLFGIEVEEE